MIANPLVNGKSWEYTDITCLILGVPVVEIASINYQQKQNRQMNYGTSPYATSFGNGTIEATVQLKISMNEMENIIASIPTGMLQDIPPFDIVVWYGDSALGSKTHIIKNCLFLDDGRNGASGDTILYQDYNLIASNIVFGA